MAPLAAGVGVLRGRLHGRVDLMRTGMDKLARAKMAP